MNLLIPQIGLIFWATLVFLTLFFLLAKFAWKPIMKAIHAREESIEKSLAEAAKAREEMATLTADNEKLLRQAREERENLLKEARDMRDRIVNDARKEATDESQRLLQKAREEIQAEKMRALTEIKNQVGILSIEIAEKVLRQELSSANKQQAVVDQLVSDLKLN